MPLITAQPHGQGERLNHASEDAIEGYGPVATSNANTYATARQTPNHWSAKNPLGSLKVGWELRENGAPLKQPVTFAFSINPQSINRVDSSRTQMFATKGAFYVDDFGNGPVTIQISQLIGSGRREPDGSYATLRQHVLQFHDEIYVRAIGAGYGSPLEVWFYDSHLFHNTRDAAKAPELVYFPPQSFQLMRSTSQHNVWLLQLTMVTMRKERTGWNSKTGKPGVEDIRVAEGETLKKLSRQRAGRNASAQRVLRLEKQIIKLNPKITKNRTIPVYGPGESETSIGTIEVKRLHVAKGEKLLVPAS
jgi:hypothetical protein